MFKFLKKYGLTTNEVVNLAEQVLTLMLLYIMTPFTDIVTIQLLKVR